MGHFPAPMFRMIERDVWQLTCGQVHCLSRVTRTSMCSGTRLAPLTPSRMTTPETDILRSSDDSSAHIAVRGMDGWMVGLCFVGWVYWVGRYFGWPRGDVYLFPKFYSRCVMSCVAGFRRRRTFRRRRAEVKRNLSVTPMTGFRIPISQISTPMQAHALARVHNYSHSYSHS